MSPSVPRLPAIARPWRTPPTAPYAASHGLRRSLLAVGASEGAEGRFLSSHRTAEHTKPSSAPLGVVQTLYPNDKHKDKEADVTDTVARPRERKERLEEILVVDCDVHVHESPEELIPYCEMPWRVALENIKDVQEFYLDIPGFSPGTTAYEAKFPSGQEGTRMVHTPKQMREELDEIHVDIGVLFPDHFLKLPVISQVEYAAALARAYNAWLLDKWCYPDKGLLGCILACPQDPKDAAREIRNYAKEPGMVGVFLPCAGLERLWGHRQYDPIYEAAQEADLPVLLHSVTVIHPVFPFNTQGFETEFGRHICSHTFSIWQT